LGVFDADVLGLWHVRLASYGVALVITANG
jgi:hypothetical protein